MTINVVWEPLEPGTCNRGHWWDQAIWTHLLDGSRAPTAGWPDFTAHDCMTTVPDGEGAVVVVPARHHANDADVDALNTLLAPLPWVLLVLTGDEEGTFPTSKITHPRLRLWVQTAQPTRQYPPETRWLPNGPHPDTYTTAWRPRTRDVMFSGQVTHARRIDCADAVQAIIDRDRTGLLVRSPGFTQGMPPADYLREMASTRIAPAPSGPVHVDSFRAWEAFELGAVPVLDGRTPDGRDGTSYWHRAAPGAPARIVQDWADLPGIVDELAARWPVDATRAAAWWLRYQRDLSTGLVEDLAALSGERHGRAGDPGQAVTVVVPTSPIRSHPDAGIITRTVESVMEQLPDSEVLIMCDGVRPEQEHYRARYEEYLHELVRLCREKWEHVLPIVHDQHLHQSGMTTAVLPMVRTPLVLFVEHDCPIDGPIDWEAMVEACRSGRANVIRLHHEDRILDAHQHLMLGPAADVAGVQMAPTIQWSQRPHLASVGFYEWMMGEYFTVGRPSMIEDVVHGRVQDTHHVYGPGGWERWWKLWIYHQVDPAHGIKRSWHLNGRGGDAKWVDS